MKELTRVKELEKIYRSVLPLKPEDQKRLDRKIMLEFNFNTNHLEGNTLTYSETEQLLIFDIPPKRDHTFRESEEMKGSEVAYRLVQKWAGDKERPFSEQSIKELNQILLVRPFYKDAITPDGQTTRRLIKVGDYKEHPNSVRLQNGEIFDYASPQETPILMGELIKWLREEEQKEELHPAVLAALFHYKFVRIHPFDDGNGRVSRLLMNYVLLKNDLPPIVVKSSDKSNYLIALRRGDSGDLDAFIAYVLSQFMWSLDLCIKASNGESLDEPGDLDKKIKLLKQKLSPNHISSDIIVKKSREVVADLFERNLKELLVELNSKLTSLDELFKNTFVYIDIDQNSFRGFSNGISIIHERLSAGNVKKIRYRYVIHDIKDEYGDYLESSLDITFHENAYELISSETDLKLSKNYSLGLVKQEIQSIVEKIGNFIVERIDQQATN